MKLRLISEGSPKCLTEAQHGQWVESNDPHGDRIAVEQSADNLVYIALKKIRNMLGTMGLVKSGSRPPEPIPLAISPFLNLRQIVKTRAKKDSQKLLAGQHVGAIEAFWGFQSPKDFYDVDAGQHGKANVDGQFDELIRQTEEAAAAIGLQDEAKVELLNRLAQSL